MGKNLNVTLNKPIEKIECQNPEHEGDRSMNSGDSWMEWPDFLFRCEACHMKREKPNKVVEKLDDAVSQEQIELLDTDDD